MPIPKAQASGDNVISETSEFPRARGFLGQFSSSSRKVRLVRLYVSVNRNYSNFFLSFVADAQQKSTSDKLWSDSWARPCVEVNGFECKCNTSCAEKVSMATAHKLFCKVWTFDGKSDERMVTQSDRKANLKSYLLSCFTRSSTGDAFVFYGDSLLVRCSCHLIYPSPLIFICEYDKSYIDVRAR
jgi:hypothetical protein